jgi:hypothetical protein
MTIALAASACFSTNGADPWSTTGLTISAGSNRLLIVGISQKDKTNTIVSVTWGTQNLTHLRTDPNAAAGRTHIYYLINPDVGNLTLSVDWSASTKGGMTSVAYTGVDQSSPIDIQNGASGNSALASVSLSGVASNCLAFQVANADGNVDFVTWNYTVRCVGKTGGAPTTRNAWGGQDTNGIVSGNISMSVTISATAQWATSAFSFKPAPAVTETLVTNSFPMEYLEKPVSAMELTSKVEGATVTNVSKDFPESLLKAGKAKELRSKWE